MVEVLDPMVLGSRVCPVKVCEPCSLTIPTDVQSMFGDDLVLGGDKQRLFVTLGQFSIIRLERDSQLLIPAYDYCVPSKECTGGGDEAPCEVFRRVQFPMEEFFPPDTAKPPEAYQEVKGCCTGG